ncbi:MAG: ATP-dependent DNA helicase RecG [Patescibacteria group bacterium]
MLKYIFMVKYTLNMSIGELPRIDEKYLKRFHKLGLSSVRDLLYHFPNRYEDYSKIVKIENLEQNKVATIQGEIVKIDNIRTFKRRMTITEAIIEDDTGSIKSVWFNQPFLTNNLQVGKKVSLSGKLTKGSKGEYLSNPSYEVLSIYRAPTHTARLIPIYPETIRLGSRYIRYYTKLVLPLADKLKEFIPYEILKKNKLIKLSDSIKNIHFPKTKGIAEKAKQRFAFEELFLLQLFVLKQKNKFQKENAKKIKFNKDLIQNFVKSLPFKLTNAQRKTAWEIFQDLEKTNPMNRLLQGDVGSGKTVVAAMAALEVAQDYQVAFMVPTEILAQQHFKEIKKLIKGLKIGLITSSESKINNKKVKKEELIKRIHEIDILIGTHALIQDKVKFNNLALVIIDEQHRFGVGQRAKLLKEYKNKSVPHFLTMTATPIPRTLALTIYGDLDISLIDEMPKGRQKIITKIISPNKREQAYEFIRNEIKKGRQVFVICPRIEPSKKEITEIDEKTKQLIISPSKLLWQEVKAVKEEYEKLNEKVFPDLKIAMIHGKLKDKDKIMKDFKEKKYDILVSTSVIEVGIDIPNTTVMMIEGADRFGLAQLHQFRGRVGRGKYQSYCFLFSTDGNETSRLKALTKCENGFDLAEKDMAIRGPGQFYGIKQSGLPDLAMTSLKDLPLIKKIREQAKELLEKDSDLKKYPLLKEKVKEFKENIHLE